MRFGADFLLMTREQKCDRAFAPGEYVVRSTVWEKEDRKGYKDLARFAGARFTCDLTHSGTSQSGWTTTTHYKLSNCK